MKTLNLKQGSPEWLATRTQYFTASEAPAMMGKSKCVSRSQLIEQKATGITPEVDEHTQRLFDRGHAAEAAALSIAEKIVGDELFPATAVDDREYLLASFDGITMMEDIIFEHKLYNQDLAERVRNADLEEHYIWQIEQQLLVSGAEKCLFMTSDGTEENMAYMWYYPAPAYAERLMAGWKQFEEDVKAFSPKEVQPVVTGSAPMDLPALHVEISGQVTVSNLDAYKERAIAVFDGINKDLKTDQDFADAETTVKWCNGIESKLAATKAHALEQMPTIDELFKTIDHLSEVARTTRLDLEKLVKAQKQNRKNEIATTARESFEKHMQALCAGLGGPYMPHVRCDIQGAMKSKRTIASLEDSADTEVARAKIEASEIAERIRANLALIDSAEHSELFADKATLVQKDVEFVQMTIKSRETEHKEKLRIAAEAEAKRLADEAAKAQETTKQEPQAPAEQIAPAASSRAATYIAQSKPVPAASSQPIKLTDYQKAIVSGIRTGYRDSEAGKSVEESINDFLSMSEFPVASNG